MPAVTLESIAYPSVKVKRYFLYFVIIVIYIRDRLHNSKRNIGSMVGHTFKAGYGIRKYHARFRRALIFCQAFHMRTLQLFLNGINLIFQPQDLFHMLWITICKHIQGIFQNNDYLFHQVA